MAAATSTHSRVLSTIGKDFLVCSICAGPFEDPRALPCLHAFCAGCLAKWAEECSEDSAGTVSCPLCKKVYQIPEGGFPAHFLLANLQSTVDNAKQANSTPGLCDKHGKKKNYYCDNCDCATCSDCFLVDFTHRGHTFNPAAFQQSRPLEGRVPDVEKKYVTAVQQVKQAMPHDFEEVAEVKIKATKEAGKEPVKQKARNNHVKQLNNLATSTSRSPSAAYRSSSAKSMTIGANCPPSLATYRSAKSMSVPANLSPSLASSTSPAKPVQKSASGKSGLFSRIQLSTRHRKKWKQSGEIDTYQHASYPCGIAVHPNKHIAVTSSQASVTVFSKKGSLKQVIEGSPSDSKDIVITYVSYIILGKADSHEFYIYNSQGILRSTICTYDINDSPSTPGTVAVDSKGRIIVGLGLNRSSTISIHQPDGTLIRKFKIKSSPHKLTCTPDDRLVISFYDHTLWVMDQSGQNASIIKRPPWGSVQSWEPNYVCCSKQGELFVSNCGDPHAVYRYVSTRGGEYRYLDCVAQMEHCPYGVALSADEEKLFVADYVGSVIKIFQ